MIPPGEPDAYFADIEAAFNRRRGAPLLLSPRDWALIGDWRRRGIPVRLVLQGLESCFDAFERRGGGARRINSLSYCRQEIEGLWEIYLGLRGPEAGRPEPAEAGGGLDPLKALRRHLTRLQRLLKQAMIWCSGEHLDPLVGACAEALAGLKVIRRGLKEGPPDPQELERSLDRLDASLRDAARASLGAREVADLEREVESGLAAIRGRTSPAALETTRRAALARRLRQRCRLPRLTLFD